ncbi:ZN829 protein, partial [Anthoscopus minutus]|nr:ZN829 protein [Anthoscopus minutus]
ESSLWSSSQQIHAGPSRKKRKTPNPEGKSQIFPDSESVSALRKIHECPECGKSFACSSHFSKHLRTHTG